MNGLLPQPEEQKSVIVHRCDAHSGFMPGRSHSDTLVKVRLWQVPEALSELAGVYYKGCLKLF